MEENKSFFDKTTAELTVKDQLVIVAVTPVVLAVGGLMVAAGTEAYGKLKSKIKGNKKDSVIVTEDED